MFRNILAGALISGTVAGLLAVALHFAFLQPLLLHAELYETGVLEHFADLSSPGPEAGPGFSITPLRDAMTALFMVLIYCGYGALLGAAMALAAEYGAGPRGAGAGALWGLSGFVAVQLAPAFGLPPEVPGVASAAMETRQLWWSATVALSAAGLALIGLAGRIGMKAAGAALVLLPHLWGAPVPQGFIGPVPPELSSLFAARALAIGLAAWVLLGTLLGRAASMARDG
ncbi:CbtA family protein [Profundibacterium mesophilum]|nr:CbtA family protein [Profundibacterium mesophilum]